MKAAAASVLLRVGSGSNVTTAAFQATRLSVLDISSGGMSGREEPEEPDAEHRWKIGSPCLTCPLQGTRRFLALYIGVSCNQCYSLIFLCFYRPSGQAVYRNTQLDAASRTRHTRGPLTSLQNASARSCRL